MKSSADTAQRTALLVKRAPLALFLLVTEKWEPTTHVRANESTKRSHFKRVLLGTQGTAQGSRVGGCGQGPSWAGAARAGCHRHPLQGARGVPEVRGLSPVRRLFVRRRCLLAPAPGKGTLRVRRCTERGTERTRARGADPQPPAAPRGTPHPLHASRRCHGAAAPPCPSALQARERQSLQLRTGPQRGPEDASLPGKPALPSAHF